jgi:hypothetical protein
MKSRITVGIDRKLLSGTSAQGALCHPEQSKKSSQDCWAARKLL